MISHTCSFIHSFFKRFKCITYKAANTSIRRQHVGFYVSQLTMYGNTRRILQHAVTLKTRPHEVFIVLLLAQRLCDYEMTPQPRLLLFYTSIERSSL